MNKPESTMAQFGIRIKMPENDPMSAPHLLGDSWANERWFDSEAERDRAVEGILRQPPYYRKGDSPSIIVEKIERPNSAS